jgi:hypothetical protein
MEDNAECMLVLIGATPEGKKELVGFQTGVGESALGARLPSFTLTASISKSCQETTTKSATLVGVMAGEPVRVADRGHTPADGRGLDAALGFRRKNTTTVSGQEIPNN